MHKALQKQRNTTIASHSERVNRTSWKDGSTSLVKHRKTSGGATRLTTVLIGYSHPRRFSGVLLVVTVAVPLVTQSQDYTYQTQSNLVILPTHVQTRHGETLYGLRPDQFVVEDNGVRQAVRMDEDTQP